LSAQPPYAALPKAHQLSRPEAAARPQLLAPPEWLWSDNGRPAVSFRLPRHEDRNQ